MYCPACGEWIQYPEQGYCEHCSIPVEDPRARPAPDPDADADRR
jgi:hypothetical protein